MTPLSLNWIFLTLLAFAALAFWQGRGRAMALSAQGARLNSRPPYHGLYLMIMSAGPALALLGLGAALLGWLDRQYALWNAPAAIADLPIDRLNLAISEVRNALASGAPLEDPAMREFAQAFVTGEVIFTWLFAVAALALAGAGYGLGARQITAPFRARAQVEKILLGVFLGMATLAVLTTVGIILSLVFEALRFFGQVPVTEFLFGTNWSPQTAIRADQVGSSGAFGAVPLFAGTLLIALIAMVTAVPLGLMSAVYLSEYAPRKLRSVVKPALEVLAGIPTVVYGFFAALMVAPTIADWGQALGLNVASQSALAAGLVMGIMIIPFVSSLSDDVINAVPQSLRDGSAGLGATRAETIRQVILPAALPGIAASVILAFSRALGETMIVVMAAGLAANLTFNPLDAVTTVTVNIAMLLVGDQEFDSAKTLSAFALGLVLFIVTLALNVIAIRIVKKYREKYE